MTLSLAIRRAAASLLITPAFAAVACAAVLAAPPESAPPSGLTSHKAEAAPATPIVDKLKEEAASLRPLVHSDLALGFLDAVQYLHEPQGRTVYKNRADGRALTPSEFISLADTDRSGFTQRDYPPEFFYYTGYGSPLVYARPLEVLAQHMGPGYSLAGLKVLDFGYGTIGHLRLMATLGAEASGVDVEPVFRALYAEPGDTGPLTSHTAGANAPASGKVTLHCGRWPADPPLATAVAAAGPYDLIISKNTLKAGYIHPAREVDPKFLVHLGVEDEAFVRAVYSSLAPGGVFMIYNICPAQAPADKPYLPHADGKCPFERSLLEKVGFTVLELDTVDTPAVLEFWKQLAYDEGKSADEAAKDLFVWYTILRKGL